MPMNGSFPDYGEIMARSDDAADRSLIPEKGEHRARGRIGASFVPTRCHHVTFAMSGLSQGRTIGHAPFQRSDTRPGSGT